MARVSLLLLSLVIAGVTASTTPFIAWNVQAGNGCANSKTVATFYFPLNTCYNNGTNSYSYSCSGTTPQNSTFASADCSGTPSVVPLTTSCVNNGTFGYRYACVSLQDKLASNERRVIQYTDNACLGKPVYYISAQEGACVSAFSTSLKVSCSKGDYTRQDFGSADCSGLANTTTAADGACLSGQLVQCSPAVTIAASALIVVALALSVLMM